jgi:hypothetical protein
MNTSRRGGSRSQTPLLDPNQRGVQDTSGYGFLGLTVGTLAGFAASYWGLVPLFPKVKTTEIITLMTTVVVAAMTLGGALGYVATRRKSPRSPQTG